MSVQEYYFVQIMHIPHSLPVQTEEKLIKAGAVIDHQNKVKCIVSGSNPTVFTGR